MSLIKYIYSIFQRIFSGNQPTYSRINIFQTIDINKIEKELRVKVSGAERGLNNLPNSDSKELDDVENSIIKYFQSEIENTNILFNNQSSSYKNRIDNISHNNISARKKEIAQNTIAEFDSEISSGFDNLYIKQDEVKLIGKQRGDFMKKNELKKPAYYPDSQILNWGIIAVILLIETLLNGIFFQKSNEFGFIGGVSEAFLFSFINVTLGYFFGRFCYPYIFHRKFLYKIFSFGCIVLYIITILSFNLALAHYRDALTLDFSETISFDVIKKLYNSPLDITDIKSWLLFVLGIIFSIISAIDAFKMDDPYPGYGKIDRKHKMICEEYKKLRNILLNKLKCIKKEFIKNMEELNNQTDIFRSDYNDLIFNYQYICLEYENYLNSLSDCANTLLNTYRTENKKNRTEKTPEYFNQPYTIPINKQIPQEFPSYPYDQNVDQDLIAKVNEKYTESLNKYSEISQMSSRNIENDIY